MTNEWGAPLTGEEMKALEGRVGPETLVQHWGVFKFQDLKFSGDGYHLPTNHPYYKVLEHNQKHGTNLVLHDGSAKVPEDWDEDGRCLYRDGSVLWVDTGPEDWTEVIAYTPKPKESEMPKDEAIEYVLRTFGYTSSVEQVKEDPWLRPIVFSHARLIQQYEPDRLKPAVDVAAEGWCKAEFHRWGYQLYKGGKGTSEYHAFKAGAAWRLNNPTA